MAMSRRGFVTGCSAAVAAFAGTSFNTIAFGDPNNINDEILISVFLRGGMDGLNLIPVIGGPDRGPAMAHRALAARGAGGGGAAG